MQTDEIRKKIITLKIHFDQIEEWKNQATDLLYQLEEQIFDIEDKEYCQKYETGNIDFFKEAASRIQQTIVECPPRFNPSRCGKEYIAADAFYQSLSELNELVSKH